MIFGDLGGLKLPDICLTDDEKPRRNLTQETCPNRSNPGPLRDKRTCYHLLHSGGPLLSSNCTPSKTLLSLLNPVFLLDRILSITSPNKKLEQYSALMVQRSWRKLSNIGWSNWCLWSTIMQHVLHALSLPFMKVLHHSESSSGDTCFSRLFFEPMKNFRWLDLFSSEKFYNVLFHTDSFCSLISLVELRQDWTSSQLPEREGREATSPFQG